MQRSIEASFSISAAAECICLQHIALSMDKSNIMAWAADAAIEWLPAPGKTYG